jgi:hypothetical protein
MALTPGTRLGVYEIAGRLGAGGMGEVYRAHDTRLQRPAAIKIISSDESDPDRLRRFEREALSASALNHPNILTVYEFGNAAGLRYIATELVDGETLRQRIDRAPLPIATALDIAAQIAAALSAAHAAGIVHRDIKPENVMVRTDGYVKVLDFGIAKLLPTSDGETGHPTLTMQTVPGVLVGTIGYMAPEQVRGLPVDQRADIWSLGVVLHEMLTGQSPFGGSTMGEILAAVLERTPPSLVSAGVAARPELERVIVKALAKDRDQRYQTVVEFASDLRLIAETGKYQAIGQVSEAAPTARGSQRHFGVWLTLGIIAAAVVWTAWTITRSTGADTAAHRPPSPVAAPATRTFAYWLSVEAWADGKAAPGQTFESAGDETFDAASRILFNFTNPQTGYVYVLNEDRGPAGEPLVTMLYPTPSRRSGSAEVPAGEVVTTGGYFFGGKPVERLWIVWSSSPQPLLEKAKRFVTPDDRGLIKAPEEAAMVLRLLTDSLQGTTARGDAAARRTVVTGDRDPLVHLAQLRIRKGRT